MCVTGGGHPGSGMELYTFFKARPERTKVDHKLVNATLGGAGGQLIETDERLTVGGGGDAPNRRRIEIRLRRSQESLGRKQ